MKKNKTIKKIKTGFSSNKDKVNIKLAYKVILSLRENKTPLAKTIAEELKKAVTELFQSIEDNSVSKICSVDLLKARQAIVFYLEYAATFFMLSAYQNPNKAVQIISESGFNSRQSSSLKANEAFSVKNGPEQATVRLKMAAAKKNGHYIKANYYFEISKDEKIWEKHVSLSSFLILKNLEQGIYYFRAKNQTVAGMGEYTYVIKFAVN